MSGLLSWGSCRAALQSALAARRQARMCMRLVMVLVLLFRIVFRLVGPRGFVGRAEVRGIEARGG
jgi:hypothetical protein